MLFRSLAAPLPALKPVTGDGAKSGPSTSKYIARVIDQDGKVQEREVRLGVRNRLSGEVLEGLREGELLVTGEQVAEGVSRFQL